MKTEHQNYEHLDAMFDKRTARGIEVNDPLADALEREHETGLVEDLHAIAEIPIGDLPSGHHESESVLTRWKHPHVRGENPLVRGDHCADRETPPRTWGKPHSTTSTPAGIGNTPTYVGKTPLCELGKNDI